MTPSNRAILFFDGDCGLCNRTVRFLIKRDKRKRLYFAPLQGVAANALVPADYRKQLSTVIYHQATAVKRLPLRTRSDAVLQALIDIGGFWKLSAKFARLFPERFRDKCYDHIANRRHRFFKEDACRLPTKEEHARILP